MQTVKIQNQSLTAIIDAIVKILGHKLPMKATYGLTRTLNSIQKVVEVNDGLRRDILVEASLKDDEGAPVLGEDGNVTFTNEEAEQEAKSRLAELFELEADVEVYQIPFSAFEVDGKVLDIEGGVFFPLISNGIITD
jgi:hypothetical protein